MIWKDGQRWEVLGTCSVPGVRKSKNVFKSEDERVHSQLHSPPILPIPLSVHTRSIIPRYITTNQKVTYLVITGGIEVCGWPTSLYPVILCFLLSFNSFVFRSSWARLSALGHCLDSLLLGRSFARSPALVNRFIPEHQVRETLPVRFGCSFKSQST